MKAVLLRSGSVPLRSPDLPGSPSPSLLRHDSVPGVFSGGERNTSGASRISLHVDAKRSKASPAPIRRTASESDVIKSEKEASSRSQCFPASIPEVEYVSDGDEIPPLMRNGSGWGNFAAIWPDYGISVEEFGFSGDGFNKGGNSGDGYGKSGDNREDNSKIGDYYREMLRQNPGDSLLLRNYGKFLYEVERDVKRAEECLGRAILANPGDGDVLSLYGKLIWETQRDESRAKSYFDRAVHASPDDCMVLGSYAHFMWEAEEEEDERVEVSPAMATAY